MISFGPNYRNGFPSSDPVKPQPIYDISLGHDADINQVVHKLLPPPPEEETDHLFCSAINFAKQSPESGLRFLDEYPVVDAQSAEGKQFVENPDYAEVVFDSQKTLEERYCAAIMLSRQLLSIDFADNSGEITEQDPRYQAALQLIESGNLAEVTLGSLALYGLDTESRTHALLSVIYSESTSGDETIDSEAWLLAVEQWVVSASSHIEEVALNEELALIKNQFATAELESAIDRIFEEGVSSHDTFFKLIKQAARCCTAVESGSRKEMPAADKLQFMLEYASKAPGSLWVPVVSAFYRNQDETELAEWTGLRLQSRPILFDKGVDLRERLCHALIPGADLDVNYVHELEAYLLGTDKEDQLIAFAALSRVEGDLLQFTLFSSEAFVDREDSSFAYSAALLIDQMRSRSQNPVSILDGLGLTRNQHEIFLELSNSLGSCPVDDTLQDYFERHKL